MLMSSHEKVTKLYTIVHGNLTQNMSLELVTDKNFNISKIEVYKNNELIWTTTTAQLVLDYITHNL